MLRVKTPATRCTKWLRCCAHYSIAAAKPQPVPLLPDNTTSTFRAQAFEPQLPALSPRGQFTNLPACQKWFQPSADAAKSVSLNSSYLSKFGHVVLPTEISSGDDFFQVHSAFSSFLHLNSAAPSSSFPAAISIYVAQAPLSDLPQELRNDVPTPSLVLEAGKGDIYSTSIWLGRAPTYTPLHRDPNPNLFVHLAGAKRVRLFTPDEGAAIFHQVQLKANGTASATMRGPEMMQGIEKEELEKLIWDGPVVSEWKGRGMECQLGPGDGLFIPKGWWHSVKGVGEGMTGSVNWWFR